MISSSESAKLDFLSQPATEELSVWLRMQDSNSIELDRFSNQIEITQAMNSKEFRDV